MLAVTKTLPRPAAATSAARRDVLEYAASRVTHKIDRDRGVIHDVKILGARSRNGGVYPDATLSKAAPLYEGVRVNIDHPHRSRPDEERTFGDWFGVMENVRRTDDGLYGDLSYLKSHPLASQVCEAAERFPASFGLSHNAQVTEAERDGATYYDKIHNVRSVDIVCRPATTRGIFESEQPAGQSARESPADAAADKGAVGDAGSEPDWSDVSGQLRDIYSSDAPRDSRILRAFGLIYEIYSLEPNKGAGADAANDATSEVGSPGAADDGASSVGSPVDESVKARIESTAENRAQRERRQATAALESLGIRPDDARLRAWAAVSGAKERAALLAGWVSGSPASARSKPRSRVADKVESAAAEPSAEAIARWADPKLAALALLGH